MTNLPNPDESKAVLLLSGGIDSITAGMMVLNDINRRADHYKVSEIYPLCFSYGQRHERELRCAMMLAQTHGMHDPEVCEIVLPGATRSSLLRKAEDVPPQGEDPMCPGIPSTFVPGRNMIMLAVAASYAASIGARTIIIGANQVDYSGYPDCRQDFLSEMGYAIREAFSGVEGFVASDIIIEAPLLKMSKSAIIRQGVDLGIDYSMTHSCYSPIGDLACGKCDSCKIRALGFVGAGVPDPTKYAPGGGA